MRSPLLFLFVLIFSCVRLMAQPAYKKQGNDFQFSAGGKSLTISICHPGMFRVLSGNNTADASEKWMVVKYNWAPVAVQVSEQKMTTTLATAQLQVLVNRTSLTIEVRDRSGKILSSENISGGGISKNGEVVQCTKQMMPDEHFFGFGERMDFIDRRGKNLKLNVERGKGLPHIIGAYNILDANYCPVPFFMSTNGYGIFFHNAYPTEWNMGSKTKNAYSFSAASGNMDYYFIYGPKLLGILDLYTQLTGRAPLMPDFAYGLHLGTYSGGTWIYEQFSSDSYVVALARKLREMGIPVDLLWLDSTWRIFGTVGGKGATSFEWRETFKDPKGMFDSLYAMHYKMVGLHLRPRFDNGKKIKLLDTAQQMKFTYPEENYAGEFVNFFDTASVNFWWNHGVRRVADIGAKFLKTDEGSAFGGVANESDKTGPKGKDIAQLHNLFPIAYAKAPYEKFQQYNGIRGLNQTREGYAGIQRYPYIFAGDWPSEWQYFAPVIKAGINIGVSGVGNWAHCMGGFEHVADPELYIRWVQFGMFSPVALVFGMDHPGYKEPWAYGNDALRNFKKYDSVRYALLPYIYSNAYHMYQTGAPLMQALVLQYQDDENVYECGDQYLFGNDLMVCPVTTKGAQTRTVYLPEGNWFDYWTGKKYSGKQYVHVLTPLDIMPVFAKAGAIIPSQPSMRYVGEKKVDVLTVTVFPGADGQFDLYEDDGQSLAYQQNKYALTAMRVKNTGSNLQVQLDKPNGNFIPQSHAYLLKIMSDRSPKEVSVNGRSITPGNNGWGYNAANHCIEINAGNNSANTMVNISF